MAKNAKPLNGTLYFQKYEAKSFVKRETNMRPGLIVQLQK